MPVLRDEPFRVGAKVPRDRRRRPARAVVMLRPPALRVLGDVDSGQLVAPDGLAAGGAAHAASPGLTRASVSLATIASISSRPGFWNGTAGDECRPHGFVSHE